MIAWYVWVSVTFYFGSLAATGVRFCSNLKFWRKGWAIVHKKGRKNAWRSTILMPKIMYTTNPQMVKDLPFHKKEIFFSTFKPQYPHTNSPNWSLYISFMNELGEFDKKSRHFPLGDHFINSHNLISWHCMDIARRKLMLVTIGT